MKYYSADVPRDFEEIQKSNRFSWEFSDFCPQAIQELDLVKELQEEVRFQEYLAKRQKERRLKDRQRKQPATSGSNHNKPRRREKSTPAMNWLRNLTCSLVYGELTPD